MGVPATLNDLDPIAANNSPSGSDPIGTNLDDYIRSHAALIKKAYTSAMMPSGTRMPFAQAAAPTGWTQDTTDNATNRMLRVVNTAGGGVAGTDSPIINSVVPSHTHTYTTGTESATHSHAVSDPGHAHALNSVYSSTGPSQMQNNTGSGLLIVYATSSATTGITLGTESATHTHSGTVAANAGAANWSPRYIDMIICSKN